MKTRPKTLKSETAAPRAHDSEAGPEGPGVLQALVEILEGIATQRRPGEASDAGSAEG